MGDNRPRQGLPLRRLQKLFAGVRAAAPVMAAFTAVVLALALFGGRPALADTVIVLNADSGAEAPADMSFALGGFTGSMQFLLAGSQLSSVSTGSRLTGIGFRLNGGESTQSGDMVYTSYTVELSTSLTAIGSMSPLYAGNTGPDVVTVRSGPLTIPSGTFAGGTGPNPFSYFVFAKPYTYTGGDLLVTITRSLASGPSLASDANTPGTLLDSVNLLSGQTEFYNIPVTAFSYTDPAAPILSAVSVSGTTSTGTTLAATSNKLATGYWIAAAQGAFTPIADQVKAGADYSAVTVEANGSGAMTAGSPAGFSVSGLTEGTAYDLYIVAEDGSSNLSDTAHAQFVTFCSSQAARIYADPYPDIITAIAAEESLSLVDPVISANVAEFVGDLTFSGSGLVTLEGGYGCSFFGRPGFSMVKGLITISGDNSVVLDKIIII